MKRIRWRNSDSDVAKSPAMYCHFLSTPPQRGEGWGWFNDFGGLFVDPRAPSDEFSTSTPSDGSDGFI